MGGILLMLALIAIIAGALYGAVRFHSQYNAIKAEKEAVISQAEAELAESKAELESLDLSGPESSQLLLDAQNEALDKARTEIGALEEEIAAMDQEISALESELAVLEQDEDYVYYRTIYDAYSEGKEYVEELIAGN